MPACQEIQPMLLLIHTKNIFFFPFLLESFFSQLNYKQLQRFQYILASLLLLVLILCKTAKHLRNSNSSLITNQYYCFDFFFAMCSPNSILSRKFAQVTFQRVCDLWLASYLRSPAAFHYQDYLKSWQTIRWRKNFSDVLRGLYTM